MLYQLSYLGVSGEAERSAYRKTRPDWQALFERGAAELDPAHDTAARGRYSYENRIPARMPMAPAALLPLYDFALSFAGENRPYAEHLARELEYLGCRVFYDRDHRHEMLGADLYQRLSDVYFRQCRFCVVISSQAYAAKQWTLLELRTAQARALQNKSPDFIIPVRMDDTELPGIPATAAYVDARSTDIGEIGRLLLHKLERFEQASGAKPVIRKKSWTATLGRYVRYTALHALMFIAYYAAVFAYAKLFPFGLFHGLVVLTVFAALSAYCVKELVHLKRVFSSSSGVFLCTVVIDFVLASPMLSVLAGAFRQIR